jgi:hypothetical protein
LRFLAQGPHPLSKRPHHELITLNRSLLLRQEGKAFLRQLAPCLPSSSPPSPITTSISCSLEAKPMRAGKLCPATIGKLAFLISYPHRKLLPSGCPRLFSTYLSGGPAMTRLRMISPLPCPRNDSNTAMNVGRAGQASGGGGGSTPGPRLRRQSTGSDSHHEIPGIAPGNPVIAPGRPQMGLVIEAKAPRPHSADSGRSPVADHSRAHTPATGLSAQGRHVGGGITPGGRTPVSTTTEEAKVSFSGRLNAAEAQGLLPQVGSRGGPRYW